MKKKGKEHFSFIQGKETQAVSVCSSIPCPTWNWLWSFKPTDLHVPVTSVFIHIFFKSICISFQASNLPRGDQKKISFNFPNFPQNRANSGEDLQIMCHPPSTSQDPLCSLNTPFKNSDTVSKSSLPRSPHPHSFQDQPPLRTPPRHPQITLGMLQLRRLLPMIVPLTLRHGEKSLGDFRCLSIKDRGKLWFFKVFSWKDRN